MLPLEQHLGTKPPQPNHGARSHSGTEPSREPPVGAGKWERLGTVWSRGTLPAPAGQGRSRALEREKTEGKKKEKKKNCGTIFVSWSVFFSSNTAGSSRAGARLPDWRQSWLGKAKSPGGGESGLVGRGRKEGMERKEGMGRKGKKGNRKKGKNEIGRKVREKKGKR